MQAKYAYSNIAESMQFSVYVQRDILYVSKGFRKILRKLYWFSIEWKSSDPQNKYGRSLSAIQMRGLVQLWLYTCLYTNMRIMKSISNILDTSQKYLFK